jgi:hypothetical protein
VTAAVVLPSTPRAGRLALWLSDPDLSVLPMLTGIFGAVLALSGTVVLLAVFWPAGLGLLGLEVAVFVRLLLAYRALPCWPTSVYSTSGKRGSYGSTVNPTISLAHWRALREPGRTVAAPLVEGLDLACRAYNASATDEATAAVVARCDRLDALHAEQARLDTDRRLAELGVLPTSDLEVGDALLEAYRSLRGAETELRSVG